MRSSSTTSRPGAIGLAAAGLLIGAGGVMHPRVDTRLEFEQGLAGMFESAVWTPSHALTLAGYVVLAISLAVLARALPTSLRLIARVATAGAGLAALESIPHILAASEAGLVDLHTTLQVVSTPAFGLSMAALAVAGARSRALDGGRVATALAVLGGLAFALAGPVIAFTENSALSPLFAGAAGVAIWAVVAGIRTVRQTVLGRAERLAPAHGHAR